MILIKQTKWKCEKKMNKLKFYFNCVFSSDLFIIENMWLFFKQKLQKYFHWNDQTIKKLIYEKWNKMNQKFINYEISIMFNKLRKIIECNDQMTDY